MAASPLAVAHPMKAHSFQVNGRQFSRYPQCGLIRPVMLEKNNDSIDTGRSFNGLDEVDRDCHGSTECRDYEPILKLQERLAGDSTSLQQSPRKAEKGAAHKEKLDPLPIGQMNLAQADALRQQVQLTPRIGPLSVSNRASTEMILIQKENNAKLN